MDTMPEYPGRILKTNEPARERRLMEQQAESDLLKKELYGLFKYPAAGAPGNRRDQQAGGRGVALR